MSIDRSQDEIIFAPPENSYIVIAPPGHGKTYTMIKRISYLINNNKIISGRKILGLTFTNSAANEMYNRLDLPFDKRDLVYICTYHSFCYTLLRAYGNKIGISPDFNILWEDEKKILLEKLSNHKFQDNTIKEAYNQWIKEKILRINDDYTDPTYEELFQKVYSVYLEELEENNLIHFDEILSKTLELWERCPIILETIRNKYQYILVDEFQDTNNLQYKILKYIIKGYQVDLNSTQVEINPFYLFGDPYQSIYIFQGALSDQIVRIHEDFTEVKYELKNLQQNYRTSLPFIDALNKLLRDQKNFTLAEIDKVPFHIFTRIENETEFVLKKIIQYREKYKLNEICIVSRWYGRLRELIQTLETQHIEYVFLDDFKKERIQEKYSFIFDKFKEVIESRIHAGRVSELFLTICTQHGYTVRDDLILNVLFYYIKKFEARSRKPPLPLWKCLVELRNDMSLDINWGEIIRQRIKDKIFVSSIHQVKGLGFQNVIILGADNYNPPRICYPCRREENESSLKEELNLIYVGLTRTISNVFITFIQKKINYRGEEKGRWIFCVYGIIKEILIFKDSQYSENRSYEDYKCFKA